MEILPIGGKDQVEAARCSVFVDHTHYRATTTLTLVVVSGDVAVVVVVIEKNPAVAAVRPFYFCSRFFRVCACVPIVNK